MKHKDSSTNNHYEKKLWRVVDEYLFEDRGKQRVTLSQYSSDSMHFKALVTRHLLAHPPYLTTVVTLIAGALFALWQLALFLGDKGSFFENYQDTISAIKNGGISTMLGGLFALVAILIAAAYYRTFAFQDFCERKRLESPHRNDAEEERKTGMPHCAWTWLTCIIAVVNLALTPAKLIGLTLNASSLLWLAFALLMIVGSWFHFWSLLNSNSKGLLYGGFIAFAISFVVLRFLQPLIQCPAQWLSPLLGDILQTIWALAFFYNCLWLAILGIKEFHAFALVPHFKNKPNQKDASPQINTRYHWGLREAAIFLILTLIEAAVIVELFIIMISFMADTASLL